MISLPKLYGRASTGKIKEWQVGYVVCGEVVVIHGQQGGKMQIQSYVVEQKNIGKANETSLAEQAQSEAQSRWNKQIKKDYREKVLDIPVSVLPNLASKYQDKAHKVEWPCHALVKLDGVRCTIYLKDGEVFFQSRGGDPYPVIQRIADDLMEQVFNDRPLVHVDGELYKHGMFLEDIVSAVKKHNEDTPKLVFCIFDLIDPECDHAHQTWDYRYFDYLHTFRTTPNIELVFAETVNNEEEAFKLHDEWVKEGYEGLILRNLKGVHTFGQRTIDFIKYKVRQDAEFRVVAMLQDKNGCAIPICEVINIRGQEPCVDTFKAPLIGTREYCQEVWKNQADFIGEWLTVEFESYSKYGKPLKPKGKAFREMDEYGEVVT